MPLLDRHGWRDDPFERLENGLVAAAGSVLVPWAVVAEALASRRPGQALGVEVANDLDPAALRPQLAGLDLVSIVFPSYADGRGFSLARRLRRLGFERRLRARGPLIADQLADALACGFDEIELDEASAGRQPIEQWLRAAEAFTANYQRGYATTESILERRRARRNAPDRETAGAF
ncbi:Uncharacterized conserved protein, DUF934 family [Tistlia consotensis]|uniref:Uncharacterized conserved protein, DUF934 family n=1 Tax=Tistlia consotensis USBA 355 TaxID=560819 RepID=A0A1Y6CIU9_9PROT|nr:DUF934 domain-containing protein [Tistlia consotensis]SMF67122.1 Uncharacterized conserved protein, DUF934 family [Tistlia consotensis USBA 355]SNS00444.1 Uncharacterized conserved protein, DUF934 family [Tistlia consotensis]